LVKEKELKSGKLVIAMCLCFLVSFFLHALWFYAGSKTETFEDAIGIYDSYFPSFISRSWIQLVEVFSELATIIMSIVYIGKVKWWYMPLIAILMIISFCLLALDLFGMM
jgi:hypothetical protein